MSVNTSMRPTALHQSSYDGWTPDLMDELHHVRSGYAVAFDTLWRDERLMRYVYWLREQAHPKFNITGSWSDADIKAEIELWRQARRQGLGDVDIIDSIRDKLQARFGFDLASARAVASDPHLATLGLPVWNVLTGSLMPESLGRLRIEAVADYENETPGMGMGYSYRVADESHRADLYLFTAGQCGLGDSVDDRRVASRFATEWESFQLLLRTAEANQPTQQGPSLESLQDQMGSRFSLISAMASAPSSNGDVMSCLSITAFCNVFLKVRVTFAALDYEDETIQDWVQQVVDAFNVDLAGFCCHYSSKSD